MPPTKNKSINPLALSIKGASQASSLSESFIDGAIRAGILPTKTCGNRVLILTRDLEHMLESLPSGRPASPPQFAGKRTGRHKKVLSP
jgi:hypothetical protein